ncbi:hypothetical protein AB0N16_23270 [Streptomyces sp. NPDC051105]|uniref:hypothetical protein n=1 Tax=Streptomyces sp. NPDC051105 TaxID=3154843 RepID=UPI0034250186
MAQSIPLSACAVENDDPCVVFGDEVTEPAPEPLAAGIRTGDGERDRERLANGS